MYYVTSAVKIEMNGPDLTLADLFSRRRIDCELNVAFVLLPASHIYLPDARLLVWVAQLHNDTGLMSCLSVSAEARIDP